jgi:MFS family permease
MLVRVPGAAGQIAESARAIHSVFRNPNLRRIQLAFGASVIGRYAISLAIGLYTYHVGGVTAVAIVTTARQALAAAAAPFAGGIADRLSREHVMLASDLARFGTTAVIAVLVHEGSPAISVYVSSAVISVAGAVFRPAEASLTASVARSPGELTAANVATNAFESIGIFAGPALGGLLIAGAGYTWAFAAISLAFAASGLFVARIEDVPPREPISEHEGDEADSGSVRAGLSTIAGEPRLRLLFTLYGAQCFVAGALGVLEIAMALSLLDTGDAGVGLLQSASGIGAIIGAGLSVALIARARLASDLALGLVLWGAPLLVIGALPRAWVAAIALAVLGAGNSIVDIAGITLIQRTASPAVVGRVFGALESMVVAMLALGALVTPIVIHAIGIRGSLLAFGAILPILVLLSTTRLRAIDRGARIPEEQTAVLRRVPFLEALPAQTLELLASAAHPVELPAGAVLFSAGDHGDSFYALAEGTLQIELADGVIKREEAPGYVGEIALLHDVPRTGTVRAVSDAKLWSVGRDDFLGAVTGHSRASRRADAIVNSRVGPIPTA